VLQCVGTMLVSPHDELHVWVSVRCRMLECVGCNAVALNDECVAVC